MSVVRACQRCRAAKVKCDLVGPICGRCSRRGLACSGLLNDKGFIFLDQNKTAELNSKRARKVRGDGCTSTKDSIVSYLEHQWQQPTNLPICAPHQRSTFNYRARTKVPMPLYEDLDTRLMERFFVNWTVYTGEDGLSSGYMRDTHLLYFNAREGSILWFAIRAIAFADMKHCLSEAVPFSTKALQNYGKALGQLRTIIQDQQSISNDPVLAALLLIDNFESLYLGRIEPLGPHASVIKHILHERSNTHLYNPTNFSLLQMAWQRMQARQVLLREEPDPEQNSWLENSNNANIPLHILADVQQVNTLTAAVTKIISVHDVNEPILSHRLDQAKRLIQEIHDFLASIESWSKAVTAEWRPNHVGPDSISDISEGDELPIPQFTCPRVLDYPNISVAYLWNFYAASQIALRESLVSLINYTGVFGAQGYGLMDVEHIQVQRSAIVTLSCTVIRSFPQLLGYMHRATRGPYFPPQGRMIGRYFALFSMQIVKTAQLASSEHQQTATEVIRWINFNHGLCLNDKD